MRKLKRSNLFLLGGIIFILFFFHKFFLFGLLPIPTDNIVGIYHPYRDFYSADYPRGIPFQNMQVSDPVRQQYLWRELAVSQMREGELPLWNPYNFSGYPLLANFQSAVFYPLNLLMFLMPFEYGWSLLIISQPILAFFFMFAFLKNLKISNSGSFISSIAFAFSGFFVSWLEWGNIVSTGLWLPLVLLSIDKTIGKIKNQESRIKNLWSVAFIFSLVTAFFAGHLQTFFYLAIVSGAYLLFRWFENGRKIKTLGLFAIYYLLFIVLTSIQWIPTLQLINLSGRSVDQISTDIGGWFTPWQNLVQFIAPDFFGNPATLNYWGVWNYGEFIGYIGILPLILAIGAIIFRRERIILFLGLILFSGVFLSFPSVFSNLPFKLDLPFISTTQPTRLMFLINFSLVVLAAFGFDYFVKNKDRIMVPLIIIALIFVGLWGYVKFNSIFPEFMSALPENLIVTYSNLRLPSALFFLTFVIMVSNVIVGKKIKNINYSKILLGLLIAIFLFDIFRFADKYTVFSDKKYLFPTTSSLEYVKKQDGNFRIMATDSRVLPPNFTISYGLQSIDGYDPLFLMRYAELAAAIGRDQPNINPPFGFNRIITPQNYQSNMIDLLNIKYIFSLTDIDKPTLEKVFDENETQVYENTNFKEKVFFASRTTGAENKYNAIDKLFEYKNEIGALAIVEDEEYQKFDKNWPIGIVEIVNYEPNRIELEVDIEGEGFLVLSDSYYPTWKVFVDGVESKIYLTNFNFRGVIVPENSTKVIFTNHLF